MVFVGRESELQALDRLYKQDHFQMAVVYGRRRVGKTTLLDHFSRDKRTLFFTAQQKSNTLNLRSFSRVTCEFFGFPSSTGAFETWEDALHFVAEEARSNDERIVFVFDEFPYAAQAEPSLPSTLQIAIDRDFQDTNVCMILCGSNEGFMESEVLGRKSPLYGRRSAQIKLQPFDWLDAARMIPSEHATERLLYYAAFGGTPYYLAQIDKAESFDENIARLFFDIAGILYAEPPMLLRQELREPALYSSILDAVAAGASNQKIIAEKAGVEEKSAGKYLATLVGLGLIERVLPFGESTRSRKGIYRIQDPFFAFWYRFVSPNIGAIEGGAGAAVAQTVTGQTLSTYMGHQFETVCRQWLIRMNRTERLPFLATAFGSWWGTDPQAKEQVDIDVIAANDSLKAIACGECKWRERFDETAALTTLEHRTSLLTNYEQHYFYLFSKGGFSEGTRNKAAERSDLFLVSAEDLFEGLLS